MRTPESEKFCLRPTPQYAAEHSAERVTAVRSLVLVAVPWCCLRAKELRRERYDRSIIQCAGWYDVAERWSQLLTFLRPFRGGPHPTTLYYKLTTFAHLSATMCSSTRGGLLAIRHREYRRCLDLFFTAPQLPHRFPPTRLIIDTELSVKVKYVIKVLFTQWVFYA